MRILVLTNKMPYPPKDGGSIASLTLALSLQNCGNEVDILSMNTSKHYFEVKDIPAHINSKIKIWGVNINTDTSIIKATKNLFLSSQPYNAERFISEDFKTKLVEILKNKNYDIVQLEGLYLCPYINTIRNFSIAKIAMRSHNIEHEIWERAAVNESNSFKKIYKSNLALRIRKFKLKYLNDYDFLIPITARDAKLYEELGNTLPIHVTPTGIDSNNPFLSVDNSKSDFPGIFHIGALDWIPNQEGLTWFIDNVWKKFKIKYPEYSFALAGRNAPTSFEKYLNNNNVNYIGEVDDAAKFINSGSIMIVPLLSGSGMRIKIIEGMAAGKTIITTSIGTEGINTSNEENILIANTPDEFLNQLEKICKNPDLHNKIASNARKFVIENYDNLNIAAGLIEFYKKHIV